MSLININNFCNSNNIINVQEVTIEKSIDPLIDKKIFLNKQSKQKKKSLNTNFIVPDKLLIKN